MRLRTVLLSAAVALALPGTAMAAQPNDLLMAAAGPLAVPLTLNTVPAGWTTSAAEAMSAVEHNPTMQALHKRMHPLRISPYVWRGTHPYWYVLFLYRGKIVASANVSPYGRVTGVWTGPQAAASYTHGGVPMVVDGWFVLVPASLLFLLAFLDPRRLRSMALLDGLAVLAFLIAFEFLAHADLEPAVWLVYPPLLYLLWRLMRVGLAGAGRRRGWVPQRLAPLLTMRVLIAGLPLLIGARIVLSLLGHQEADVGYESLIGASRLLHHLPLYWNDPTHGDTYGPVTYLTYVPFQLLFSWKNTVGHYPGADVAAIVFDLGTMGALLLLGRRLREGADGTRLGLILVWAWAACPFTVIGLVDHTNDGLVAMLTVFAFVVISSPVASGAVLGLATAAKFSPGALVPLLAAPRQRGIKGAALCVGVFLAVVVTAIVAWLPPQGFGYFWQRTIGFQMTRPDVLSPWALHPTLHPIQVGLEVAALLLVTAVAFVPRDRSLASACALAGAITIAIQLPAAHWYYFYIMWFLPFALAGLLGRAAEVREPTADEVEVAARVHTRRRRDAVLAGV